MRTWRLWLTALAQFFLNNSISTTILSSAGWSVGTGESGETLVVAQVKPYTTLKNLGGLTVDDQIGAYKFLTNAAVWEPSWVDDDGASNRFLRKMRRVQNH